MILSFQHQKQNTKLPFEDSMRKLFSRSFKEVSGGAQMPKLFHYQIILTTFIISLRSYKLIHYFINSTEKTEKTDVYATGFSYDNSNELWWSGKSKWLIFHSILFLKLTFLPKNRIESSNQSPRQKS